MTASPLENCFLEGRRAVIKILVAEGFKSREFYSRMLKAFGIFFSNHLNICKYVEPFKSGSIDVTDEQRSGRPVVVATSSLPFSKINPKSTDYSGTLGNKVRPPRQCLPTHDTADSRNALKTELGGLPTSPLHQSEPRFIGLPFI